MSFVNTSENTVSSAAEHLEMQLVQFAAGVAVYEMPVRFVENSVLVAFAETAMNAAATTAVPDQGRSADMTTLDLCAHFHARVPADVRDAACRGDRGPLRRRDGARRGRRPGRRPARGQLRSELGRDALAHGGETVGVLARRGRRRGA